MSGRGGGGYASGKNALAICERCSRRIPYKQLLYDGQYPDLRVCQDCWDPKHPQEYLPDTFDPITLYDPTGDPDAAVANLQEFNPVEQSVRHPVGAHINTSSSGSGGDDLGVGGSYAAFKSPLEIGVVVNRTYYNIVTGSGISDA